jgi:hypothetical protein
VQQRTFFNAKAQRRRERKETTNVSVGAALAAYDAKNAIDV